MVVLAANKNNPPTFCSDSAQNCHLWRVLFHHSESPRVL